MPKLKKLSLKQKGFVKDYVELKNGTEAAFRNYPVKNRNMASVIASKNLDNPMVVREIDKLMEEGEITDKLLMGKLKEGLDAYATASFEGEVIESGVPDHFIRHKFLQDALKMKGFLKDNVDVRSFNIDLELESMPKEDLAKLLKGLLVSVKQNKVEQEV